MDDPVAIARNWLGTPYRHQASVRGAGCDCLGLVRGIWRELHGTEPESVPAYSPDWSEPQGDEALWRAALRHLDPRPLDEPYPGDVVLFRMRAGAVAKHLGVGHHQLAIVGRIEFRSSLHSCGHCATKVLSRIRRRDGRVHNTSHRTSPKAPDRNAIPSRDGPHEPLSSSKVATKHAPLMRLREEAAP